MHFAKEMLETKAKLESLGHTVEVPCDINSHIEDTALKDDFERDVAHVKEHNVMMRCFDLIAKSDAVLALNHRKNDIDGYLGASTLMEIGLAAYLGKKIFLLNPVTERYKFELAFLGGEVINGDLSKIA